MYVQDEIEQIRSHGLWLNICGTSRTLACSRVHKTNLLGWPIGRGGVRGIPSRQYTLHPYLNTPHYLPCLPSTGGYYAYGFSLFHSYPNRTRVFDDRCVYACRDNNRTFNDTHKCARAMTHISLLLYIFVFGCIVSSMFRVSFDVSISGWRWRDMASGSEFVYVGKNIYTTNIFEIFAVFISVLLRTHKRRFRESRNL